MVLGTSTFSHSPVPSITCPPTSMPSSDLDLTSVGLETETGCRGCDRVRFLRGLGTGLKPVPSAWAVSSCDIALQIAATDHGQTSVDDSRLVLGLLSRVAEPGMYTVQDQKDRK